MLKNFLYSIQHTELGKYIISIILGIGLASLFRKSCEGRSCMVFRGPSMDEIRKNTLTVILRNKDTSLLLRALYQSVYRHAPV